MKNKSTFILAMLIVATFMLYAVTFQVDYNEVAVVTTFGRATSDSVYQGDRTDAGAMGNLHFRWPWPVQQVRTYDRRMRVYDIRVEELQTRDNWAVAVSSYVAWRITDPLAFYSRIQDPRQAEQQIRGRMRDAHSVIGNYTFDQLTNTDESQVQLEEVEQAILDRLRAGLQAEDNNYGFEIESVGLKRIVLPESVTQRVFERMAVTRERLAERALSEGDASAENIRARADSASRTILAFAQRRADAIEAQGYEAAEQYNEVFQENEEFAIFLQNLETYREVFRNNTTFFIDAKQGGLGSEFYYGPQVPVAQPPEDEAEEDAPTEAERDEEEESAETTALDASR